MLPQEAGVGYRRNGKQQACEPCRKGKLACDHVSPHCSRCVRRKTTDKCIYHPAPMTRGRALETPLSVENSNSSALRNGHHRSPPITEASIPPFRQNPAPILENTSVGKHTCGSVAGSSIHAQHQYSHVIHPGNSQSNWKSAIYQRSARYYGPTSFSAVFSEHHANLNEEILDIGDDVRKHPGSWIFGPPLLGRQRPNTPLVRTTHVIKALLNIPSRETCKRLIDSFKSMHDSTLDPTMISHCISTMWTNFGSELGPPRTNESLAVIADVLFNNEEMPLPPSPDDGMEWLNTFVGPNIRFEMLGLLFCFFGMAYRFVQDCDPLFSIPENEGLDKKQSIWRMKECADVCLSMCNSAETVNFLVTALICNIKVLESTCTGDETYKIRQLHGDMVTSAISAGLHRLPSYGSSRLTAASEYKRRLFSALYCSDKTHSSLNRTPPLLSRLYCDVEPCLDIDLKATFLLENELVAIINGLDANGWNTSGNIYHNTLLRAKVQLNTIREEILELALGVNIEVSGEQINDLHYRSQEIFDLFPPQIHYYREGKIPNDSPAVILYETAHLVLQYLQSKFLLDRVAIARGFANGQGLLETAMEMLDLSLMFWIKRDQLIVFSSDFDWIITYYGVPAAGVICVELLKISTNQTSIQFSHSDAIQKLTLFISFLEWVRSTHGNFKLAGRLKNVIKSVLNHVLEQPHTEIVGEDVSFDPMLSVPFNELDDLEWLNTIDWTQGSWMDVN